MRPVPRTRRSAVRWTGLVATAGLVLLLPLLTPVTPVQADPVFPSDEEVAAIVAAVQGAAVASLVAVMAFSCLRRQRLKSPRSRDISRMPMRGGRPSVTVAHHKIGSPGP